MTGCHPCKGQLNGMVGGNEKLMQLAGHLRGRARQEWDLLSETEKGSYFQAVQALHGKLEPVNKALAAQDFCHICQGDNESVADFIRRMEHTFKVAYGRDSMSQETRNALLHGQLQDGLRYEIMKAPAVSGAQTYSRLCLASRNKEKRLLELKKRLQYQQTSAFKSRHARTPNTPSASTANKARDTQSPQDSPKGNNSESKKCYICGKAGHLQRNCRQRNRRQDSNSQAGQPVEQGTNRSRTNMIRSRGERAESPHKEDPYMFLLSDSEEEDNTVSLVRVQDGGSKSQAAQVEVAGVPAYGIVDTGANITIMGPELFKKVAMVAKLKKRQFKEADKVPHTYDRHQFKLDGRLDLDINFDDKTINTPIYVKMDAYDDLLLSEGVCRHLGIVTYHPSIKRWPG